MSRIVPEFIMGTNATTSISGLPELQSHLQELENDGTIPFNAKLFDDVELQLTEDNIPSLLPTLLPPLTTILKSTTQDPTPLLTLTIKLLSPLTFTRTLTIADPPSLITALRSPLPGANLLALAILHKAASAPSDAAILSTLPDVFEELVRRWLEAEDVGVGEKAARVLGDLLETDCEVQGVVNGVTSSVSGAATGQARLWRLLFHDRSILSLIPDLCSLDSSRTDRQRSISQGRLLRLLPRLATLNLNEIMTTTGTPSRHPDLFRVTPDVGDDVGHGVLPWAALAMVDRADMLMHLMLIDFFETFVSIMRVRGRSLHHDDAVRRLVAAAVRTDDQLESALRSLPDRTVEEEAEPLRRYIQEIMPSN